MLRVVDAGIEVAVKGKTQRRVLAALLARVDGQISLSELVDALWPENPPANAVKNVQSYIAKLKHVLGDPGLIGSGPGGYRLTGGRFDLDAQEFTNAVRRAQQARLSDDARTASSMVDEAFGLWRGRPYADLQDWRPLHPEVERLEQAWLDALAVGVDLGMHSRMLPQLTALVEESPYRERAVALLMRVLHAVGRQAEALELYWSTKTRLSEELGIDPTPELQDLYQALLQGEPARTSMPPPSRSEANRGAIIRRHSDSEPALSTMTSRLGSAPRPRFVLLEGMPRPPKAHQERSDQLQALVRLGNRSESAVVCSLTGGRGVGKTQLAASYARLRLAQGWSVAWIDAESRERLTAGLADLADVLGLSRSVEDAEYAAMKAQRWLSECRTPALLVLDNAVDPDLIRQWQPTAGSVQIVVTSSRRVFGWLGDEVEVGVFTAPQARSFMQECTGLVDDATDHLVEAVGGYPLALALAAAVITRERLSCQEYLRRLSALPLDAALAPHDGDPYPRGIGEAIRLSLAAAEQQKPQARSLGELVAVLSTAGVARSLLVPDDAGEDVRAELSGILGSLADTSLIGYSQDGDAVIMHRLTRRTIREAAAHDRRLNAAVAQAVMLLKAELQSAEPTPDVLAHTESLLELAEEFVLDPEGLAELLDLGDQAVASYREPAVAAYTHAGKGGLERLNHRLLAHQERVLGPNHAATLRSQSLRSASCREVGKVNESIDLGLRTLAQQEWLLGTDHADALDTRIQLVISYMAAGRWREVIPILEETIAAQERVLGKGRWETLRARMYLAWVHQSLGRIGTAVELEQEVVADCDRLLGHDHPDSLWARMDLGCIYRQAGDLNRSIQLQEQNVADSERILGADSGSVQALNARGHLAGAYRAAGRTDEAVRLLESNLVEWEGLFGPDHIWTLTARNNLACAYASARRTHEAANLLEQTLSDFQRVTGHNHPRTLNAANNLACVYAQAGLPDQAIPLLERTLQDRERILGAKHPDTCTSAHNLGAIYHQSGRAEDATQLFENSRRTSAPPEDTLWLRNSFAHASIDGIDETIRLPLSKRSKGKPMPGGQVGH